MGRRRSKRGPKKSNFKKNNSNKNRENSNEASSFHEQESKQKTSFDEIAEIFLGSNTEKKESGAKSTGSKAKASTAENNTSEASDNNEDASKANYSESDKAYEEMKARQQELLNNIKNLSEAIVAMTLIRDNIASLKIEVLSNIYFTREVRPLIDAVNLIAFASSNMSIVAQNLNINASGDRKEVKDAFKLCYKMNDEIADMLGVLSRRIKLYVAQLNNMDRNCPPFSFDEDSRV
ncbi:hypothetical protein [Clostridium sp. BL-8]|uniref:hypothetical protein n=1 Tax=Clostridium sp. BL-8 TaxID=349938 RepID=UPI00098C9E7A|nr:hypothetical protein [Clostridium sp. BL-8]OOM70865.1 hypothetical protein CLOBL_50260 [Clostridium sp. BL-8]